MKTLINVFHPKLEQSTVNRLWAQRLEGLPDVTVRRVYSLYPDGKIDVAAEQSVLLAHDRLVFQHPFYWYSIPPLMKQWLDDVLTVTSHAASQPPSKLGLGAGQSITLDNAMRATAVRSANDMAVAIGDSIGPAGKPAARQRRARLQCLQRHAHAGTGCAARHFMKPSSMMSRGKLRPMKTMRLTRGSSSRHSRLWSPSSIMCTACAT